jgi:ribonuclease BN (tRNA processing enzyme)
LNPETAAKIASDAKAKKLVLTHFDANIYKTMQDRAESLKFARGIFPNAEIAFDGMQIEV